jgi:nucleoside-diphosphate-sugar epimerase
MRILITGSEGKIGKEVVKLLPESNVLLIDKKIGLNLNDNKTQDLIEYFNPEIVIHLAASFERTDETPQFHQINYEDNILATYNLNKIVYKLKSVKQYIYASSYLVYDPMLYLSPYPLRIPRLLDEVDELNPRNLIGASKLYGENEIAFIKRNVHKDMVVTNLRIFRVFGDGGQEFVSRVIEWKQMGLPVEIWKPENRFDFIHTSDVASAIISCFGHEGTFNVGSGDSTSIRSIVETVDPIIKITQRDDLYESSCADITLIKDTTKWEPKVNVIEWIKSKL